MQTWSSQFWCHVTSAASGFMTGFHHSIKRICLDRLYMYFCIRIKNRQIGIVLFLRLKINSTKTWSPFHMDLKKVRTRSFNHHHYVLNIIHDNLHKAWVYCLHLKSDALCYGFKCFTIRCVAHMVFHLFALRVQCGRNCVSWKARVLCQ